MIKQWKIPPRIKLLEALGAIADGRIQMLSDTQARVISSSETKSYDVVFSPLTNEIYANDNGSFWQGYVGYPSLAFLMKIGVIPFHVKLSDALAGIPWKEVNTRFKNDFSKTEQWVFLKKQMNERDVSKYAQEVFGVLEQLQLVVPEKRKKPPKE